MKKNIKKSLLFSLIGLTSCMTIAIPLASCKTNTNINVVQHKVTIDVLTNTELLSDKWTIDDWMIELKNLNLQSSNLQKLLDVVNSELQKQNINQTIEKNKELIISITNKNYVGSVSGNLDFIIYSSNNFSVNVTLQNLYVYSDSIFVPPSQEATETEQVFEQVNLSLVADTKYDQVSDALWTNAINSTKNGQGFIVPPTIYVLNKKTLSNDEKSYDLVYTLSDIYRKQVEEMNNKADFKDVKIKIILSPYIGKDDKTLFKLDQQAINKYFSNNGQTSVTIDQVKAMNEKAIYDILKKYVDELPEICNIAPLRDCEDKKNPGKIIDFSSSTNIVGNTKELTIQFKSNGVKTYAYKFVLTFS